MATFLLILSHPWDASLAQSVGRLAFDFGSAYDLTLRDIKPCIRLCADSMEPAWDSPSPSLSPPLTHSLSQNKKKVLSHPYGRGTLLSPIYKWHTEAQRGEVTFPKSHSQEAMELVFEPGSLLPEPCFLFVLPRGPGLQWGELWSVTFWDLHWHLQLSSGSGVESAHSPRGPAAGRCPCICNNGSPAPTPAAAPARQSRQQKEPSVGMSAVRSGCHRFPGRRLLGRFQFCP